MQSINPTILWEGRRQEGEETGRGTRPGQRDGVGQAIQSINYSTINQTNALGGGGDRREARRQEDQDQEGGGGESTCFCCCCLVFVAVWFASQCGFCCSVVFVSVWFLLLCSFCRCVVCVAVLFVAVWFSFLCGLWCCMVSVAVHSVLHQNHRGFFIQGICQHVPLAVDLT